MPECKTCIIIDVDNYKRFTFRHEDTPSLERIIAKKYTM